MRWKQGSGQLGAIDYRVGRIVALSQFRDHTMAEVHRRVAVAAHRSRRFRRRLPGNAHRRRQKHPILVKTRGRNGRLVMLATFLSEASIG